MGKHERMVSIDFDPEDNSLGGLSDQNRFFYINTLTGETVLNTEAPLGKPGERLTFDYGWGASDDVSDLVLVGAEGGQYRATFGSVGAVDQAYTVAGGGSVSYAKGDVHAGTAPRLAGVATHWNWAKEDVLYGLDAATDSLVKFSIATGKRAATLSTVKALGLDVTEWTGFDARTGEAKGSRTGFASFVRPKGRGTVFCTVDLTTGRARTVGTIGGTAGAGGATVRDVAVGAEGEDLMLVLDSRNRVILVDTANASVGLARTHLTGLRAGESLVSMDARPGTGEVFAVTTRARLVEVDLSGGVVRGVGERFLTHLGGRPSAADFEPGSGKLVVVTARGTALRIDVDTGKVVDEDPVEPGVQVLPRMHYGAGDALAGGFSSVRTIAHTRNLPGAAGSVLYGYDGGFGALFRPSADGTMSRGSEGEQDLESYGIASIDVLSARGRDWAYAATGFSDPSLYRLVLKTGNSNYYGTLPVFGATLIDIALMPA
jgi:hypothetical protein